MFGGLNEFEVRDFLHVLAEDIRHLTVLVDKQNQHIKEMEERVQDYKDREQLLKRSIVSAQEIADKIQKDTEQKSRLIIARANDKSESLVREARSSLQSVYNDIASLKRLHLQFKSGLKASLQSQMDLLEQNSFVFPVPAGRGDSRGGGVFRGFGFFGQSGFFVRKKRRLWRPQRKRLLNPLRKMRKKRR